MEFLEGDLAVAVLVDLLDDLINNCLRESVFLAGEDFAEIAALADEGPYGAQGGKMGTYRQGELVETLDAPAFALQAGELRAQVVVLDVILSGRLLSGGLLRRMGRRQRETKEGIFRRKGNEGTTGAIVRVRGRVA